MVLSAIQLQAILEAKQLLDDAGVSIYNTDTDDPDFAQLSETIARALPSLPSPAFLASLYNPAPARSFTPNEIVQAKNQVNRLSFVDKIISHPLDAIVEYPETGSVPKQSVAHMFSVNPDNFYHPKANFQYSLGDCHGMHPDVKCDLLLDSGGRVVISDHVQTSCTYRTSARIELKCLANSVTVSIGKGLKTCSAYPDANGCSLSHSFISRPALVIGSSRLHGQMPEEEVFLKTLAFYCVLVERGCQFRLETADHDRGSASMINFDQYCTGNTDESCCSSPNGGNCTGCLILHDDRFGRPYVQYVCMNS